MKKAIYFDMDGTIANFYGVATWLEDILARDTRPYATAKPLVDTQEFVKTLNELRIIGYEIGIITWLAKNSNADYDNRVAETKKMWLAENFNFQFDEIIITKYGTPKAKFATKNDILFDDEKQNRDAWNGKAYDVEDIVKTLKKIAKGA